VIVVVLLGLAIIYFGPGLWRRSQGFLHMKAIRKEAIVYGFGEDEDQEQEEGSIPLPTNELKANNGLQFLGEDEDEGL